MHAIERYGIVALLFLVVTVVAVLMWDGGKGKKNRDPVVGTAPAVTASRGALDESARDRRLRLVAESQPGPLTRTPPEAAVSSVPLLDQPQGAVNTGGLEAAPAQALHAPLTNEGLRPGLLEPAPPAAEPVRETVIGRANSSATHTYTVQAGDTLTAIAQRELGSAKRWQEILGANPGLDPAKLRVGKALQIPGSSARAVASPNTASAKPAPAQEGASASKASSKTWKVGKGENLWRIAERALGDGKRWREIAALNPRVNPDKLVLGQLLVMPGGAKGSTQTPPRTAPKKRSGSGQTLVASAAGTDSRRGGRVR